MKKSSVQTRHNNLVGYLFILPFLIGLFAFTVYPFVYSLYLSFTDYDIVSKSNWIGFRNYVQMFTADEKFWISFKVTCKLAVIQVPLKLIFSLLVAVLLARTTRMTGIYRAAFYLPSLLGGSVAVAITWKQLWGNNGVFNKILSSVGLPTVNWLNNTKTALYILLLLGVWQFGSQMLIFLAGIKDIPKSLHEAAIVDGANKLQRIWHIDVPAILPTAIILLIIDHGSIRTAGDCGDIGQLQQSHGRTSFPCGLIHIV